MSFKGYAFDDSIESSGGARKPYCTQGYYLGEVGNVAPSPEDLADDKSDYFRWDFRLAEGPSNVGRVFPHYTTLGAEKQYGLGGVLQALGAAQTIAALKSKPPVQTYEQHAGLAATLGKKFKNQKLGLLIADGQPYRGNPSSDIQEIMTEAEYRERVKLLGDSGGSTSGAVPSSPAPAGGGTLTAANVDALLSGLDDI